LQKSLATPSQVVDRATGQLGAGLSMIGMRQGVERRQTGWRQCRRRVIVTATRRRRQSANIAVDADGQPAWPTGLCCRLPVTMAAPPHNYFTPLNIAPL